MEETGTKGYNDTVIVESKSIPGYTYDSKSKDSIVIDTENNIAYVYYTKQQYNYTVNYYDKDTNELLKTTSNSAIFGNTITAAEQIITIPKYTYYSSDKNNITISDNQTLNVLNLYYIKKTGNVIVKYVDKTTNLEISDRKELVGKLDDSYQTESKNIPGYKLVETTNNTTGIFEETDKEVIYYYQKQVNVTTNYIDKLTNTIMESKEDTGYVGDSYQGISKDIEGYVLVEKPESETIVLKESDNVLNYYYAKISDGVIEKHIDINSNEILYNEHHSGNVGDEYNILSREFEDYALVQEKLPTNSHGRFTSEPIEVIYYYKKKAKLIVKYLDQHTGEEIAPKEEKNGYEGDDYSLTDKEIKGYTLKKVEGNKIGKYESSEITVIYYYEKIGGYSPQTSDDRNIIVWVIIGIISIVGIVLSIRKFKK